MARGRKTGGRRQGTPNKRTIVKRQQIDAAAADMAVRLSEDPEAALVPQPETEFFKGDAHALLRLVYRDPRLPLEMRVDAAKAAVRFERPALTAAHVQHSNAPSQAVLAALSTDQLRALLQEMDGEADQAPIEGPVIDALPAPDATEPEGNGEC